MGPSDQMDSDPVPDQDPHTTAVSPTADLDNEWDSIELGGAVSSEHDAFFQKLATSGAFRSHQRREIINKQHGNRNQRTRGCVGLANLGNTCYINSAVQCIRSVEELTKYFLTGEAYGEINPSNPLAFNGDLARAYGHL